MKKEEAIKVITGCAKKYRLNLENKNLLFVFDNSGRVESIEAVFLPGNFLHLTGIRCDHLSGKHFYQKCLDGRLSPSDVELTKSGTTEMKLQVLPLITDIHKTAKMLGDYNHSKTELFTDKLAGNVKACLGFVRSGNYYVPNTVLREDIRDLTTVPTKRILAIFRKESGAKFYRENTYLAT
ncbi:MAG TPA: PBECR4 domain-containing protein, partial [Terriglobales bacterium]|nr:PBECR4 domain-containing protein [Terriglobales bacterium]